MFTIKITEPKSIMHPTAVLRLTTIPLLQQDQSI